MPSQAAPSSEPPQAPSLALVVDDESTSRLILKAQLEREAYRVVAAADGQEALALYAQTQPDIVFLDVVLPDFYGYEVARQIKQMAGERFVPIIFLTGLTEEEALAECVAAGGDDFLSKPFSFSILKSKIAAIERIRNLYSRVLRQREELSELHGRMQYEQDIAERIFTGAVMARNVAMPPIQTWLQAASTFNGDIFISAYTPSGGLSVLMGDFTGHGLAAALGALPTAQTFRSMTAKGFSLGEVLIEINHSLNRLLPTGMFLAAGALRIDADLKTALVWNSGLPDILLCRGDGSRQLIGSQHPPLGALPKFIPGCEPESLMLMPGDVFVMCSDGVTEASSASGQPYGEQRLLHLLDAFAARDAFDAVRESLSAFVEGTEQQDDISLVAIPCVPELFTDAQWVDESQSSSPLPDSIWRWSLHLEGANLRQIDPIPLVMSQLSAFGVSAHHRQQMYVVVAELFNNALEHGVLGISSSLKASAEGFMEYYTLRQQGLDKLDASYSYIELSLEYHMESGQGVIRVCVEDSGRGFDYSETDGDGGPSLAHSGRGIRLLRSLCRSVRYIGCGNRAEADYLL